MKMLHTVENVKTPPGIGAIRRLLNGWQGWGEIIDYGPYDYMFDRIRQLEDRVLELEHARNTSVEIPPTPAPQIQNN